MHASEIHSISSHIYIYISDENTSQNRSVSPNHSISFMNHHHINHFHKTNDHRLSVSSLATTTTNKNEPVFSPHFTSTTISRHDPLFNLGSIMSPAAYTNAPTTSCGLELSYGASSACQQPQFHNHCALSPPSSSFQTFTQAPPLTSESIDGCNNIMRIIDQTFRDNPEIFTDNYLKKFQTEARDSVPGTSNGETVVSRDLTMTFKFDDDDDEKEKKITCECVKKTNNTKKEENSWQLIESNDCKLIQQRIEYFESFCPDTDLDVNSKAMFLYKENKIISGDNISRKNEIKLGKTSKQQAICSDSHDSGYANASSNDMNREKSACSDCCYCNPQLHNDPKSESCAYCRNKTPDHEKIPDTPCSMHGYYETLRKSNHVHTRIKSRESDTVSVKCTKTNERIKRTCCQNDCSTSFPHQERVERKVDPKGSKAGLSRPKDINNILRTTNVQKVEKEIHDKISRSPKLNKHHTITKQSLLTKDTKPKEIRLPSPYKGISSNSYESTSDSSCSLTCSPTKKTTLPQAHWQQSHTNLPSKSKNHAKAKTTSNTLPRASRTNNSHYHTTAPSTPEHKLTAKHNTRMYEENLDNRHFDHHHDHNYTNNHHPQMNNNNNNENENIVTIDSDTHYNNFVNNNNINASTNTNNNINNNDNNNCTSPNIITTCHTTTNNVNTNGNNNMTTTAGK